MTNFEEKHKEFKEAFRNAVLNRELECDIERLYNDDPYIARFTFNLGNYVRVSMAVAKKFICYHNEILRDAFLNEDIKLLLDMVSEKEDVFAKKRIEELESELAKLKNKVA